MKVFISFSRGNAAARAFAQKLRTLLEAIEVEYIDGYHQTEGVLNAMIKARISSSNMLLRIVFDGAPSKYIVDEHSFARSLEIPILTITDHSNTLNDTLYSEEHHILIDNNNEFQLAVDIVRFVETVRARGGYLFTSEPGDKNIQRDREDMLDSLIESEFFKISQRKKNFCYDIVLEEHDINHSLRETFYKAFFHIRFEATLKSDKIIIETARTIDNFQKVYSQLIQEPSSAYRYILKTNDNITLGSDVFCLKKITVNDAPLVSRPGPTNNAQHFQYLCESSEIDLVSLVGSRVRLELEIETIVDKRRSEFTIIFGYPVKNINISFIYRDTDISNVEIVDVVTAKEKVRKNRLPGNQNTGVRAILNGWAFPDSAIVCVWSRDSKYPAITTSGVNP